MVIRGEREKKHTEGWRIKQRKQLRQRDLDRWREIQRSDTYRNEPGNALKKEKESETWKRRER